MADLGSQKLNISYKSLLQKDENGMVADGSGSLTTLNISGSEYYTSASAQVLKGITVTGSIIPQGNEQWDIGSEDNPFKHIFVSNNSIIFVDMKKDKADPERRIRLTKQDISNWQQGDFSATRDITSKKRLDVPIVSNIRTTGVEPFVWDNNRDLVSNNLTNMHIVSDRFWSWNSNLNELEPKSIMFGYASGDSPSNELVIGG